MMRLRSDLAQALLAACRGRLDEVELEWSTDSALVVVMAALGYPGSYQKGSVIRGLEDAEASGQSGPVKIFHAGTAFDTDRQVVSAGGRVLGVTAVGVDVAEAQQRAYGAVDHLQWPEGFCRRDIGWRAVAWLKAKTSLPA